MSKRDLLVVAVAMVLGDLDLSKRLVDVLGGGELEEKDLTERLETSPSEMRIAMYKLQDANLAIKITRREDEFALREIFWHLNEDAAPSFINRRLSAVRRVLEERRGEEERGEYYVCAADPSHIKVPFDEAAFSTRGRFLCPVCGASLIPVNKEKALDNLERAVELIDQFSKRVSDA